MTVTGVIFFIFHLYLYLYLTFITISFVHQSFLCVKLRFSIV